MAFCITTFAMKALSIIVTSIVTGNDIDSKLQALTNLPHIRALNKN
jgi:hypothetical protein